MNSGKRANAKNATDDTKSSDKADSKKEWVNIHTLLNLVFGGIGIFCNGDLNCPLRPFSYIITIYDNTLRG